MRTQSDARVPVEAVEAELADVAWWKSAVVCQVHPRSFADAER